ncbi:hypothetical protein Bca4012_063396 [Brassica carinata]
MSKRSGSSAPLMAEKVGREGEHIHPISKSGSSSDPHDESEHDLLAQTLLSYVSPIPPLVRPASSVGEDDLNEWRKSYSLSSAVVLRIPGSSERASNGMPEEIAVNEAFFESGFRGDILIVIQNLGDEESLPLGVNEVVFAYHLAPINGGEGRFHLHPHAVLPIVEELSKNDRKGLAFGKKVQERYAFMNLLGSHYRWNFVGRSEIDDYLRINDGFI